MKSEGIQAASERFQTFLREKRKRKTGERFAILECVCAQPGHFNADTIYEKMDTAGYHVSLATVYSTLQLMCEAGLVCKHFVNGTTAEYERLTATTGHVHLVCSQCGRVREIRDAEVTNAIRHHRYPGQTNDYFTLNIYGLCTKCQRKKKVKV